MPTEQTAPALRRVFDPRALNCFEEYLGLDDLEIDELLLRLSARQMAAAQAALQDDHAERTVIVTVTEMNDLLSVANKLWNARGLLMRDEPSETPALWTARPFGLSDSHGQEWRVVNPVGVFVATFHGVDAETNAVDYAAHQNGDDDDR